MRITIVVAAALNGVIGDHGRLPWRIPSDLRRFRAMTMGRPVVMGRKTFQSLPKALDGRDNIVVTRARDFAPEGALVVHDLDEALDVAISCAKTRGVDEVMVIGGAEIYAQALPRADRILLTRVDATPAGDARFADPDPALWTRTAVETIPRGPNDDHAVTLETWQRRSRL